MKRTTRTKRALVASAVSVALCAGLLLGTTLAWFTDSAKNTGNTITAGTLDVELNDGETTPLFSSDNNFLWEPGRSQMSTATVSNAGSLWLKYMVRFTNIETTGNADLTDVLDVYAVEENATSLEGAKRLGTVKELANASEAACEGILAPTGQTGEVNGVKVYDRATVNLVIKMQESAGNEYQDCGVTFDVVADATQYTYEKDGFGNDQYDADADYEKNGATIDESKINAVLEGMGDTYADRYAAATTDAEKKTVLVDAGLVTSNVSDYYANRMIHGLTLENGLVLDQGSFGGLNLVAFVDGAETLEVTHKDGPTQGITVSEGKYLSFSASGVNTGVSTYTLTFKNASGNVVSSFDAKFYCVAIAGNSGTNTVAVGEPQVLNIGYGTGQTIQNYSAAKEIADIKVVSSDESKVKVNKFRFEDNGDLVVSVTREAEGQVYLRYIIDYKVSQYDTDGNFTNAQSNKPFCKVN